MDRKTTLLKTTVKTTCGTIVNLVIFFLKLANKKIYFTLINRFVYV